MASQKEAKQEPLEKQLWKAACKLQKNIDKIQEQSLVDAVNAAQK